MPRLGSRKLFDTMGLGLISQMDMFWSTHVSVDVGGVVHVDVDVYVVFDLDDDVVLESGRYGSFKKRILIKDCPKVLLK